MRLGSLFACLMIFAPCVWAQPDVNAAYFSGGFVSVGDELAPRVLIRNDTVSRSLSINLKVRRERLGPDATEAEVLLGPVTFAANEEQVFTTSFSPDVAGSYYIEAEVLSSSEDVLSSLSSVPQLVRTGAANILSFEYLGVDDREIQGGSRVTAQFRVENLGEEANFRFELTGVPRDWLVGGGLVQDFTMSAGSTGRTVTFNIEPPVSGGVAPIGGKLSLLSGEEYVVSVIYDGETVAADTRNFTDTAILDLKSNGRDTQLRVTGKNVFFAQQPASISYQFLDKIDAIAAFQDGVILPKEQSADIFFQASLVDSIPLLEHVYPPAVERLVVEPNDNDGGPSFGQFYFPSNTPEVRSLLPIQAVADFLIDQPDVQLFDQRKVAYSNIFVDAASFVPFYQDYPEYYVSPKAHLESVIENNRSELISLGMDVSDDGFENLIQLAVLSKNRKTTTMTDRAVYIATSAFAIWGSHLKATAALDSTINTFDTLVDTSSVVGNTYSALQSAPQGTQQEFEALLIRIALSNADARERIDELRKIRDLSPDNALREAFDETIGQTDLNGLEAEYNTLMSEVLNGVRVGLSTTQAVSSAFALIGVALFPPSAPFVIAAGVIFVAAEESIAVQQYLEGRREYWVDAHLSYTLREEYLSNELFALQQQMGSTPVSFNIYRRHKILESLHYFLGFRDIKTQRSLNGDGADDVGLLASAIGYVYGLVDHEDVYEYEGRYVEKLQIVLKTPARMAPILERSVGDEDGDGVDDFLDAFPLDSRYVLDQDEDGLADEWEVATVGDITSLDGSGDFDRDGISDAEEFRLNTDPVRASHRTVVTRASSIRRQLEGDAGNSSHRVIWDTPQSGPTRVLVTRLNEDGSRTPLFTTPSARTDLVDTRAPTESLYEVVLVDDSGALGPPVIAKVTDLADFEPFPLQTVETEVTPGSLVHVFGRLEHQGFLVEEGRLVLEGRFDTRASRVENGRVYMEFRAPSGEDECYRIHLELPDETIFLNDPATKGEIHNYEECFLDSVVNFDSRGVRSLNIDSSSAGALNLSWSTAPSFSASGYVVAIDDSTVSGSLDNTTDDALISVGAQVGGAEVVYVGSNRSTNISGLELGRVKHVRVIPYQRFTDPQTGAIRHRYGSGSAAVHRVAWGGTPEALDNVMAWNNELSNGRPALESGIPHEVVGLLSIPRGFSLTIEEGSTVTFRNTGSGLNIAGTLTAIANDLSSKILFKPSGAAGDWRSIWYRPGSEGELRHVEIQQSGGSQASGHYAALYLEGKHRLNNVVIRDTLNSRSDASASAIRIAGAAEVEMQNVLIDGAERYGIEILDDSTGQLSLDRIMISNVRSAAVHSRHQSGATIQLSNSRFTSNGQGVRSTASLLDVRFAEWGDDSGPLHATLNPNGQGDEVSGNVLFDPWGVDSDGDEVPDRVDLFPDDASEWADNDGDGIGDNADPDDDNDDIPDEVELANDLDPFDETDADADYDNDGVSNRDELAAGTDPRTPNAENHQFIVADRTVFTVPHERPAKFAMAYDNDTNEHQLSGLQVRMHFDSTLLTWGGLDSILEKDRIRMDAQPQSDGPDFDNDPSTDVFVSFDWASVNNDWPDLALPVALLTTSFTYSDVQPEGTETHIRFSSSNTSAGFGFTGSPVLIKYGDGLTYDVDSDGNVAPLTDGLIILRYLFGFSGDVLIRGAVDSDATRTTATDIQNYLLQFDESIIDIDGDGDVLPLTDGLLLIRYLFGFSGSTLVNSALGRGATRSDPAEISDYIEERLP